MKENSATFRFRQDLQVIADVSYKHQTGLLQN